MNKRHITQLTPTEYNPFLADVGSLLTKRIAAGPSSREAEVASNFAAYLSAKRRQQGLSRAELAQQVGKTEFDIYALEQGIQLPHQISYLLSSKLAAALDEDPALLALILERDMVSLDSPIKSDPSQLLSGSFKQWIQKSGTNFFASNMRLSNAYAVGVLLLILFLPQARPALTVPTTTTVQPPAPMTMTAQTMTAQEHDIEWNDRLKIVYTAPDSSWFDDPAYFAVDQERVATVAYIPKPVRSTRSGCESKYGGESRPCST